MLENFQGINPIGLGATLADYNNNKFFTNKIFSPTNFRLNTKMRGINSMGLCDSLGLLLFSQLKYIKKT